MQYRLHSGIRYPEEWNVFCTTLFPILLIFDSPPPVTQNRGGEVVMRKCISAKKTTDTPSIPGRWLSIS